MFDGRDYKIETPAKTKPDLSLRSFYEFCRSKPAGETYPYTNFQECAVAQWVRSMGGRPAFGHGARHWHYCVGDQRVDLRAHVDHALWSRRTFGALAKSLRRAVHGPWYVRAYRHVRALLESQP